MSDTKKKISPILRIYYDGACHLCSREMEYYEQKDQKGLLRLVDISDPYFDPDQEGVDPKRVHRVMHVKREDGEICTDVDAFMAIWNVLPGYYWLSLIVGNPLLRPFFLFGYYSFARLRRYLPRRRGEKCR